MSGHGSFYANSSRPTPTHSPSLNFLPSSISQRFSPAARPDHAQQMPTSRLFPAPRTIESMGNGPTERPLSHNTPSQKEPEQGQSHPPFSGFKQRVFYDTQGDAHSDQGRGYTPHLTSNLNRPSTSSNDTGVDRPQPPRKRPHQASASQLGNNSLRRSASPQELGRNSTLWSTKPATGAASSTNNGTALPSILLREKKQKACANCRRAKLKCIMDEGVGSCVRCNARKETCTFLPRSHNEDSQQTLAADVHACNAHMTKLSAVLHHLLVHLRDQNLLQPSPLADNSEGPGRSHPFDMDIAFLQEFGGVMSEQNEGGRKRSRKDEQGRTAEEEDCEERMEWSNGYAPPMDDQRRSGSVQPLPYLHGHEGNVPRQSVPQISGPVNREVSHGLVRLQSTDIVEESQQMSAPQFPPFRPQVGMGPAQLTPIPKPDSPRSLASGAFSAHGIMSRGQSTQRSIDQSQPQNGPPTGLTSISPMVETLSFSGVGAKPQRPPRQAQNQQPYMQQGVFAILRGMGGQQDQGQATVNGEMGRQETVVQENAVYEEILGAADPRPNIVKKGIVPQRDAMLLVNYFHANLSQFLFGYRLEFTKFPYIPQGPPVITPFILSILCLVSSERLPHCHPFGPILAREIEDLLINSPSDSFVSTSNKTFGGGAEIGNDDYEDDELDPETGIGPEEIVGACILATFMNEREQAVNIASSAFKWARGWIKWTSLATPLPPTLGEVCGLLPIKRDASREDMARIWLLCYIVEGTEALQRDNPLSQRRDPMSYCRVLIPDSPQPGEYYTPNDVLLVFHARLITLLRDWYHSQCQLSMNKPDNAPLLSGHSRLASTFNAQLEWWRANLEVHCLDDVWTRQIDIFWLFARMLVNATTAKILLNGSNTRLRSASLAYSVEAAIGLLERCSAWDPGDDLTNLPPSYLSMITLAGSVLVDAIKEQSVSGACPITTDDVVPLLRHVSNMLRGGSLPPTHVSRSSAAVLMQYSRDVEP